MLTEKQNRQGFLRYYSLKPLWVAAFKNFVAAKPLQKGITVFLSQ